MIKVKELIVLLEHADPERVVLLSSDEEGNSVAPLAFAEASRPGETKMDDGETDLPSVILYPSEILQ